MTSFAGSVTQVSSFQYFGLFAVISQTQRKMMRILAAEVLAALICYAIVAPIEVGALITCSCYKYSTTGATWDGNRNSCKKSGQDLVSMETDEEWEFIKNAIQKKSTVVDFADEWHIGLYKNESTRNWTWVNEKPLTIQQWQPKKPDNVKLEVVAVIAKSFPSGSYGKFNNVRKDLHRAYICENVTTVDSLNCPSVCWTHPTTIMTSSSSPSETYTASVSTEGDDLTPVTSATFTVHGSTTPSPVKPSSKSKTSSKPSVVLILAVVLGVLSVVVAVALGIILLKRYRRSQKSRTKEDAAEQKPKLNEQQSDSDNPYDNVKQEAAKLLGIPKEEEEAQTYAEISERNDTYATVDKTKKKKREDKEELCYAELGDLDNDTGSAEPEKPAPFTPTVYADVVGTVQAGSLNKPSEKPGEAVYANMS